MGNCECVKQDEQVKELEIHRLVDDLSYRVEQIERTAKKLETRLDPVLRNHDQNEINDECCSFEVSTPLGKELLSFNIHLDKIERFLDEIVKRLEI